LPFTPTHLVPVEEGSCLPSTQTACGRHGGDVGRAALPHYLTLAAHRRRLLRCGPKRSDCRALAPSFSLLLPRRRKGQRTAGKRERQLSPATADALPRARQACGRGGQKILGRLLLRRAWRRCSVGTRRDSAARLHFCWRALVHAWNGGVAQAHSPSSAGFRLATGV